MAEHAMADVMEQSGNERDSGLRRTVVAFALTKAALNRAKEKPGGVKHAEAVREPRVDAPGKTNSLNPSCFMRRSR